MTVGTRATTFGQLDFSIHVHIRNYSRFSSLDDGSLTDSFSFLICHSRAELDGQL